MQYIGKVSLEWFQERSSFLLKRTYAVMRYSHLICNVLILRYVSLNLVTFTEITIPQKCFTSIQIFRCLIFQKSFTSPPTTNGIISGSPILQDEESRDSGIFLSDESTCNLSTPVAKKLSFEAFFTSPESDKELSFKSFFASPDTTPKAAGFCKARRTFILGQQNVV